MKIIEAEEHPVLELYPIETEEQLERIGEILVDDFGAEVLAKEAGPGYQCWTLRLEGRTFDLEHSSLLGNRLAAQSHEDVMILARIQNHFTAMLAGTSKPA